MQPTPRRLALALALSAAIGGAQADSSPQTLPFAQDWSDTALITANNDWSGVPGIIGFRGDGLASGTGANPQTILAPDAPGVVNVIANQANPNTNNTGGVAEFQVANPVVAFQGSGTARAPYIRIHLDTRGASAIQVSYLLRDLDSNADNSVQPVSLQYRVGGSGDFVNVPEAFVADASAGPSLTKDTPVSVTLPAAVDNQALVELRVMTADAVGSDEWIGIDDIRVVAGGGGGPVPVIGIGNGSVAEGDSGPTEMFFQVSLSQPAGPGGVSFNYATVDDTALAGADYVAKSGTANIAEGDMSVTLSVSVIGDTVVEPEETFGLVLSNINGALGGTLAGTGTIINDDFVIVPISAIQGPGATSPLVDQVVVTTGIVTARKSNGFFMQTPDGQDDGDEATSEGLFVFTAGAPGPEATVGHRVRVQGTVLEYIPAADPHQLPMTELGFATVAQLSTGHALPAPVVIDAQRASPDGGLDQLERFEGMRVTVPDAHVVAPTRGFTNESSATSTGNGQFAVVAAGLARPLREPGIQVPDPDPSGTTATAIPRWDFNSEVIAVDSDTIGAPQADVAAGCILTGDTLTGPLDYTFRRYTVYPEAELAIACDGLDQPRGAVLPGSDHASFATYNLQRFFDTVNDPVISEPVLTADAFAARLNKASLGIRAYMHSPDIIGVSEVENLGALQALAGRINADAVALGGPDPGYVAYLAEGNDVGGIDVGFLVKAGDIGATLPRVDVLSVEQVGKDATWTYEGTGESSLLNDRPPLVLDAVVNFADGRALPVTVVAVHQRSLNDVNSEDPAGTGTLGDRVRRKRQLQAEFLADLLQGLQADDPERNLVVLGDFNAFEFNDGHADVMGTVTGMPSADATTAVNGDGIDLVEPDLVNATWLMDPAERYSFVFENNAQSLDHILVNQATLASPLVESWAISHARLNADFPETARNDAGSAARLSDHDPSVLMLRLPALAFADMRAVVTAPQTAVPVAGRMTWQVTASNAGPDAARFPGIGFALDAALPDLQITAPSGWVCDAPTVAAGETTAACTADALASASAAAFTASANAPLAADGASVTLSAAATSQTRDPDPANDGDSASISVDAVADLRITLNGFPEYRRNGQQLRYSVLLSNSGPSPAIDPNVHLAATLTAARVTVVTPEGWSCARAPGQRFAATCTTEPGIMYPSAAVFQLLVDGSTRMMPPQFRVSAGTSSSSTDPVPANDSRELDVRMVR
ncbi:MULTISPECIES: Calx-beta domain-containing protein [unclassified Luteimonas]|uniref:Calx-beta domain-containing protein n=1 Tax=unclassified Luteimonas TaxID=2629088 RepID=UPI0018F0E3B7|nr:MULTISPECIES: Calx-beta domain-containing protein [unclassified Luteimonas]MBJ6978873.1 nuclease [Luteimonas sp. MC1895]MBJ6984914.1 nuclease [Luteimonas sp. MC1750]QQO05594.1 nuclease [Luteimonas sp. MC1750]